MASPRDSRLPQAVRARLERVQRSWQRELKDSLRFVLSRSKIEQHQVTGGAGIRLEELKLLEY